MRKQKKASVSFIADVAYLKKLGYLYFFSASCVNLEAEECEMRRGIIGSTLTVFFIATVIFFSIYLFVPEVSQTVFGVSFSEPEIISAKVIEKATGQKVDKETVKELNELLKNDSVKNALKESKELLNNDAVKKLLKDGKELLQNEEITNALKEGKELTESQVAEVKKQLGDVDIKELESAVSSLAKKVDLKELQSAVSSVASKIDISQLESIASSLTDKVKDLL